MTIKRVTKFARQRAAYVVDTGHTADAGYCSTANLEAGEQRGLEVYISTSRQQHGQRPRPSRGRPPKKLDARGRTDRKLRSKPANLLWS